MRVLIIEDDAVTRDWVEQGLRAAGHATRAVGDGRTGLALAVQESYDGIVVDRRLPGLDGLGVIRALRQADVQSGVIVLTALSDTSQRIEGLDAGADDYLGKPFALPELLARLRALSRRPARLREPAPALLVAGPLSVDVPARLATCHGQRLELTPTEFRLLEALIEQAGKLVTRSMLLERIWQFHFSPRTSMVETHVSRLRAKLDALAPHQNLLETVRGYGYRLRTDADPL